MRLVSMKETSLRLLFLFSFSAPGMAWAELRDGKLETKLVPNPVEYAVLLPEGYQTAQAPLPLLLFLHGGGGDKSFLGRMRPVLEEMWKAGALPPMVVVTPSAERS